MSGWVNDRASAIPTNAATAEAISQNPAQAAETIKNPQEHGWAPKLNYDYESYTKSNKELLQSHAGAGDESVAAAVAVGGIATGDWASNATVYPWDDEFGDVGPKFAELEKQLFGAENHVRTGIKFDAIQSLEVIQEGNIRLQPVRRFQDAGLHPVMLENVGLAGYDVPTPIQQYCLPAIKLGHDIVACAQTGSGKTAAFLVPVLSKLMGKAKKLTAPRPNPATFQAGQGVRAEPLVLVVCPSRELATQIFDEARRFCYRSMLRPCVIYGGGPIAEQIASLEKGCDVLIGTPGRLIDFINRPHILTLKRLQYMIIDEADEMLHSDWESELKQIMSGGDQEEGNITYMMFSATFPKNARDLAKEHLAHDHVRIRVGRAGSSHLNIKQDVVFVEPVMKRQALVDLLFSAPPARTIIFVNSKRAADEIDDHLFNKGFPCTAIHSDRTQREREDSIRAFRSGKAPILIATGVSARGLDIHNVMHIVNYELPSSQYGGIEEYTHRIGRTGRIGNMGLATSFYNDRDSDLAETLVKTLLETRQFVPDFLESFIPEGFTTDGAGDVKNLKFDADSDNGEDDENGGVSADAGGGAWGSTDAPTSEVWGATPTEATAAQWGVSASAAPTSSINAGNFIPTIPIPVPQPAPASTWTAPIQTAQVEGIAHASKGWVPPVTAAIQQPAAPASNSWDHPITAATQHPAAPVSNGWDHPIAAVTQHPAALANNGWNSGGDSWGPSTGSHW